MAQFITTGDRCLATNTIETHLARFIESGEVKVRQLVQAHKIEPIKKAILKLKVGGAAGPVKEFLGDDYSYGEIRAVLMSMKY